MNYLAICPSCRIAVTGHSLGGAMASLFTYFTTKVSQFGSTSMILSTYGQPRSVDVKHSNLFMMKDNATIKITFQIL
jgi:putative lipase involved disintegration of autophagic bodies